MVIFSPRIFSVSATFCGHEHTCCSFIQQGLAKFYRCNTQDEGKMLCICCCRCCCCSFIQQGLAKFYRCNTQDEGKMLCICCCRCCCCTFTQPGSYYQSRCRADALPRGVAFVIWTTTQSLNITIPIAWIKYIAWITDIAWTQIQIHCMDHRHCMDPNTNAFIVKINLARYF